MSTVRVLSPTFSIFVAWASTGGSADGSAATAAFRYHVVTYGDCDIARIIQLAVGIQPEVDRLVVFSKNWASYGHFTAGAYAPTSIPLTIISRYAY